MLLYPGILRRVSNSSELFKVLSVFLLILNLNRNIHINTVTYRKVLC